MKGEIQDCNPEQMMPAFVKTNHIVITFDNM